MSVITGTESRAIPRCLLWAEKSERKARGETFCLEAEEPMIDSYPEAFPLVNRELEESNRIGPSTTERELIELFDKLRIPLLRYLSSFPLALHDSEDVIQDAFLSLFQQFRRGKSVQDVRGWLFRAAHNVATAE
jgi:hypothetical protein